MAELKRVNFSDLALLLWRSNDHFRPFQDFLKLYDQSIYKSVHNLGIIQGCEVTVDSGLTLNISEGLVLFDNGGDPELALVEAQQVDLSTADASNPRIDRLELILSIENGDNVTDTQGTSKVFDRIVRATATSKDGTPAASPSAPVKTSGAISLGTVSVAASQTVLASSDISLGDNVRDRSYSLENHERTKAIPTSTSGQENIKDVVLDKTKYKQYFFDYQLHRKTDTVSSGIVASGTLHCFLNPETGDWVSPSDDRKGNDDLKILFDLDASSGQLTWEVGSISGANHIGEFTFNVRTLGV